MADLHVKNTGAHIHTLYKALTLYKKRVHTHTHTHTTNKRRGRGQRETDSTLQKKTESRQKILFLKDLAKLKTPSFGVFSVV